RHQEARPVRAEILRVQDGGRGDGGGQPARRRNGSRGMSRLEARGRAALLVAIIGVGIGLLGSGCEGRTPQPRGLGPYRFGVTTRANITQGVCQPTELTDGRKATWCFALPPIKVGKRVAEVDAYFLGTEPPALPDSATTEEREARKAELAKLPLIEVQLKIRGCVETEAEHWMRERFGPAQPERKG